MQRWMLVVGARPNMMKVAALLPVIARDNCAATRLVHTGQHFDDNMSKVFFKELDLPQPDVFLGIGSGSPSQQIARILLSLESEIESWQPDLMIVVGDVNSTLAAALLANKCEIRLAHVEAGLRSFDRSMPEEHNRILTDQLSDFLFTPSSDADQNLLREGVSPDRIFLVGNVMVDTLLRYQERAQCMQAWQDYNLAPGGYSLVTMHRAGNVDQPDSLEQLVNLLAAFQAEIPVIFPVHPRTQARLENFGFTDRLSGLPNLIITPPLGYLTFLSLMGAARLVITDSGGIQEETTMLGVPCLTVRKNTERPVTIHEGTNQLVGIQPEAILKAFYESLHQPEKRPARLPGLWDGKAAERIVKILSSAA